MEKNPKYVIVCVSESPFNTKCSVLAAASHGKGNWKIGQIRLYRDYTYGLI